MSDQRARRSQRDGYLDPEAEAEWVIAEVRARGGLASWRELPARGVMRAAERAWRLGWDWAWAGPDRAGGRLAYLGRDGEPLRWSPHHGDFSRMDWVRASKVLARCELYLWPIKEAGAPWLVDPTPIDPEREERLRRDQALVDAGILSINELATRLGIDRSVVDSFLREAP